MTKLLDWLSFWEQVRFITRWSKLGTPLQYFGISGKRVPRRFDHSDQYSLQVPIQSKLSKRREFKTDRP